MNRLLAKSISCICALTLSITCVPAAALASTDNNSDAASASPDAKQASSTTPASTSTQSNVSPLAENIMLLDAPDLSSTVSPYQFSSEMTYFAQYESGDYDQGFSSGDSYHALGCYQFDNRYDLQNFLIACYNYDPTTYSMLAWLKDSSVDISSVDMYDSTTATLTEMGQRVESSWHAAYAADPEGFSRLQDGWQYQTYYQPALDYLNSRGLNMDSRRDCVKGLACGVMALFGSGGWRRFVGGTYNGVTYEGAGLTGDMTDRAFVTALCNYIVDHVAEFYPSQTQYHAGWQNRYRNELANCLEFLGEYPDDVSSDAWYVTSGAYDYVTSKGLMSGYSNGYFGPDNNITRGEIITVLWRLAGQPSASASDFSDVDYSAFYGDAVRWARETGVVSGYENTNTFAPEADVSRQELAVMLANYASIVDSYDIQSATSEGNSTDALASKADANTVSSWAYTQMNWIVAQGIIQGIGTSGLICPLENATRAQFAEMLLRYSKLAQDTTDQDTNNTSSSEYILAESNSRYYTRAEIEVLSDWDLKVAHNEIYARYGKGFRSSALQAHFDACSWYTKLYSADEFDALDIPLNEYEQANANLMAQIRSERGV